MSQGKSIQHAEAYATALRLVGQLSPGCERIEIAGSLRRAKATVHDIEIVAVPRVVEEGGLWGDAQTVDKLEELLAELIGVGSIRPRPVENHRTDGTVDVQFKMGPAFKALETGTGVPVDLFIVRPPATWGVIFGLRTGPGAWNIRLVDECKAISRRVREGQVEAWVGATGRWEPVPTPEEADFFAAIGQSWVEPADRAPERVAIRRELASGAPA